jgi:hypothetical protein
MPVQAHWWRGQNRLLLVTDGFVDPAYVLPPPDPHMGEVLNQLGFTTPAIRMRVLFPGSQGKCMLSIQITIEDLAWGLPTPLPDPLPPLPPPGVLPFSFIEAEVKDVTLGSSPIPEPDERTPAIGLSGIVVANPVPSPFGDLTGAPVSVSAGYRLLDPKTGETAFSLLGAWVAGSHLSICPTAAGILRIRP